MSLQQMGVSRTYTQDILVSVGLYEDLKFSVDPAPRKRGQYEFLARDRCIVEDTYCRNQKKRTKPIQQRLYSTHNV